MAWLLLNLSISSATNDRAVLCNWIKGWRHVDAVDALFFVPVVLVMERQFSEQNKQSIRAVVVSIHDSPVLVLILILNALTCVYINKCLYYKLAG